MRIRRFAAVVPAMEAVEAVSTEKLPTGVLRPEGGAEPNPLGAGDKKIQR